MKFTKKNSIIIFTVLISLSFILALINKFSAPKKINLEEREQAELQALRSQRADFLAEYYQENPEQKCQEQIYTFYNVLTHYWESQKWDLLNSFLIYGSQAYFNQKTLYDQMLQSDNLPEVTLSFEDMQNVTVENGLCSAEINLSSQSSTDLNPIIRHFELKLRLIDDDEFLFEEINLLSTE